jgi:hypothetical protein
VAVAQTWACCCCALLPLLVSVVLSWLSPRLKLPGVSLSSPLSSGPLPSGSPLARPALAPAFLPLPRASGCTACDAALASKPRLGRVVQHHLHVVRVARGVHPALRAIFEQRARRALAVGPNDPSLPARPVVARASAPGDPHHLSLPQNILLLLSTQGELVESKNRSRALELRYFSCPNLMHEFEFEVRISDQIQTAKMAVGRHLKFYSNITNSLW